MTRKELEVGEELLRRERLLKAELVNVKKQLYRIENTPEQKRIQIFAGINDLVLKDNDIFITRNTYITMLKQTILDLNTELLALDREIEKL